MRAPQRLQFFQAPPNGAGRDACRPRHSRDPTMAQRPDLARREQSTPTFVKAGLQERVMAPDFSFINHAAESNRQALL